MKKTTIVLFIALALLVAGGNVFAGTVVAVSANATVKATLNLATVRDMNFGTFIFGTAGTPASLVMSSTGAITPTNAFASGSPQTARFTITGSPNAGITITLPSTDQTIYLGGNDKSLSKLTVNSFLTSVVTEAGASTTAISDDGEMNIDVYATLDIGSTAPAVGSYSWYFAVSVAYN